MIFMVTCASCTQKSVEHLLPPPPSADEAYPQPTKLAERTDVPLSQLLAQYEQVLLRVCPDAHAALQEGLSQQQLEALEREYDITLTDELRTLYSWRNGSAPSPGIDAFPYMRFVPLKEALDARNYLRNPDESKSSEVRELQDAWLGFRYSWVGVLENGAGDGYFYDPNRRHDESCFFYTVHDDIGYMFYPSVGNYFEELLELDRRNELSGDDTGVKQDSKWTYSEEKEFLNRFGQWVE
ncbi:beta-1 3-glucan synthesis protein [Rhodopirellula maiorica SM1]|uniref:Beta-1 3-glucan synthesis protein n=2 Tax=Novipirellula TaxID=2795426 RepID=M5R9X5_9BACT|nr:beta-1 3-glucan synthesis protein [Rhodopirellula maiorica SM1]